MAGKRIPVEGGGFLADAVKHRLLTDASVDRRLSKVAVAVADYANQLVHELPAPTPHETSEEKQRVIALALFVRLVECYEAILILAAFGVREEGRSLLRVFLDAYFVLANVCSDPAFVGKWVTSDEVERLKFIRAIGKHDHEIFQAAKEYADADLLATLAAKVKEEGIDAFNSFVNADKVGCANIYDSLYRITSSSVHTGPRILERYMDTDSDGTATTIFHQTDPEIVNRTVYDAAWFCLTAIRGVLECYGIADVSRTNALADEFGVLKVEGVSGDLQVS